MRFKDAVLKPVLLLMAIAMIVAIFLATCSFPKEFGLDLATWIAIVLVSFSAIFMWVFDQGDSSSVMTKFFDLRYKKPLSYNRLMSALGEISIAATILAIAIGYAQFLRDNDSIGWLSLFSALVTIIVCLMIALSMTSLISQCFDLKKGVVKEKVYLIVVSVLVFGFSNIAVSFGIASGLGVAEYYSQARNQVL